MIRSNCRMICQKRTKRLVSLTTMLKNHLFYNVGMQVFILGEFGM